MSSKDLSYLTNSLFKQVNLCCQWEDVPHVIFNKNYYDQKIVKNLLLHKKKLFEIY